MLSQLMTLLLMSEISLQLEVQSQVFESLSFSVIAVDVPAIEDAVNGVAQL